VDHAEIQGALRRIGIRVEPEMAEYLGRQMQQQQSGLGKVAVLGGDARTGVPVRRMVAVNELTRSASGDQAV
jgi:hypothetical protein